MAACFAFSGFFMCYFLLLFLRKGFFHLTKSTVKQELFLFFQQAQHKISLVFSFFTQLLQ